MSVPALRAAVSEKTAGGNTLGQAGMSKMLAERRGDQLEAKGLVRGSQGAR
jgi:hypothetical protein